MTFRLEKTLAGYARAAVDLRIQMAEHTRSESFESYAQAFMGESIGADGVDRGKIEGNNLRVRKAGDAVYHAARAAWSHGESYVMAPAMTAVVAAAAESLDLTGETVTIDDAPARVGILWLPEPIYETRADGSVNGIAAITWAPIMTREEGRQSFMVLGYAEQGDPYDPFAIKLRKDLEEHPEIREFVGPYVMISLGNLNLNEPLLQEDWQVHRAYGKAEVDVDWETDGQNRYVVDNTKCQLGALVHILYAFWKISQQTLVSVANPPTERHARKRAVRASIRHDTRVVMLRRAKTVGETDGEVRWRYKVQFVVRGHWRRLTDKEGKPYRIWINAYIKGPEDAPLLGGEKVNVLGR